MQSKKNILNDNRHNNRYFTFKLLHDFPSDLRYVLYLHQNITKYFMRKISCNKTSWV